MQGTGGTCGIPRLGFALCLLLRIGYVDDSRTVIKLNFHASRAFPEKQLLHFPPTVELTHGFCVGCRCIGGEKMRYQAVIGPSIQRVSCQGSGAVLASDCFDCAPAKPNFLQISAGRVAGFPGAQKRGTGATRLTIFHSLFCCLSYRAFGNSQAPSLVCGLFSR
jgi:hypothetical protein